MSGMVGMPAGLQLQMFGSILEGVFKAQAYHVGSSVTKKKWRDIDVRVMLDEKQWKHWGLLDDPTHSHIRDPVWIGLCMAFSELGRNMTGLPIDFQLQQRNYANKHFKGVRSALGMVPWRFKAR